MTKRPHPADEGIRVVGEKLFGCRTTARLCRSRLSTRVLVVGADDLPHGVSVTCSLPSQEPCPRRARWSLLGQISTESSTTSSSSAPPIASRALASSSKLASSAPSHTCTSTHRRGLGCEEVGELWRPPCERCRSSPLGPYATRLSSRVGCDSCKLRSPVGTPDIPSARSGSMCLRPLARSDSS